MERHEQASSYAWPNVNKTDVASFSVGPRDALARVTDRGTCIMFWVCVVALGEASDGSDMYLERGLVRRRQTRLNECWGNEHGVDIARFSS
jgi:hypothetical protein